MILPRILLVWVLLGSGAVQAAGYSDGFSAGDAPPRYRAEEIIGFAKKVERLLAARGARVAIVARMGRPLSEMPAGMRYTHVGFAVYSRITADDGRILSGYAMYNLYQDAAHPDKSALIQDYPVDFFAGVAQLEAAVLIPSAELQRRLISLIASPEYAQLHDPHYSAIANPYTLGKQNCTEFVLDVVNAAIYQTAEIKRIKAGERQYFTAQTVNVDPFKLMLGALFSADISLSDQGSTPQTATFETIAAYLERYDAGAQTLTVLPGTAEN